jgi:hypothetical protein
MCIFTGGGCIFLNYGVHGYGKTTFPLFTVGFWLSCQDKGKERAPEGAKGLFGFCFQAAPGDVLALFPAHACVCSQMTSGLITFLWAYIFLFYSLAFPHLDAFFLLSVSSFGCPSFFFGWISHSRRYACSWRSNRNNLIPIVSYRIVSYRIHQLNVS